MKWINEVNECEWMNEWMNEKKLMNECQNGWMSE